MPATLKTKSRASPLLLSRHTSNPFEVPSSDPLNAGILEEIQPFLTKEKAKAKLVQAGEVLAVDLSSGNTSDIQGARDDHTATTHWNHEDEEMQYGYGEEEGDETVTEHGVVLVDSDGKEESEDEDEDGEGDEDDADSEPVHLLGTAEADSDEEVVEDEAMEASSPLSEPPDEYLEQDAWEDELDDEEKTLLLRDPEEREEIEDEMQNLEEAVPRLKEEYRLIDRLGEGTFSSVYKAVDLKCPTYYNRPWQASSSNLAPTRKSFVALKRIYVTSSPSRILNEIAILEDCRGCRDTCQIVTAFREADQIVVVTPYSRHEDFRTYYHCLPLVSVRAYFRCLFRALRDIHARGIAHRDVKPANFLFDPHDKSDPHNIGKGTLVDFGLAQRIPFEQHAHSFVSSSPCNHTLPSATHPHGRQKPLTTSEIAQIKNKFVSAARQAAGPTDKIGVPSEDTRSQVKANRAGTRGFRAPEVLFKCPDQTVAIDVWAAGIILVSVLSCKFPIFAANDDVEALMEIAAIVGKGRMEKCAKLHNRTFMTNVPAVDHDGLDWGELVGALNNHLYRITSKSGRTTSSDKPPSEADNRRASPTDLKHNRMVASAIDLANRCLNTDATRRITAREALYHPFLAVPKSGHESDIEEEGDNADDGDDEGDDLMFPHPFGEGVCAEWHWKDDDTGDHCVTVKGSRSKIVAAGEGIAIGNQPCEFHTLMMPGGLAAS